MKGAFEGLPFDFRSADVEAIKEVLFHKEYRFLSDFLEENPQARIVDAGHHIGCFSLWLLSRFPKAKILGLEADPQTFAVAEKNAAFARRSGYDWNVLHKAAWKDDETISFSCEGDTMGHKVSQDGHVSVPCISLKTLLDRVDGSVDLMKIDIEGAEEAFLKGGADLLKERVKALVIEIHPRYCDENKVLAVLEKSYENIGQIPGTQTDKPLLWCYNES